MNVILIAAIVCHAQSCLIAGVSLIHKIPKRFNHADEGCRRKQRSAERLPSGIRKTAPNLPSRWIKSFQSQT
jgi:hypothetical protein